MKAKTNDERKICESCGKDFLCSAKSEKCWCFEIDLTSEILAKLQEDFKSCLCENCLEKEYQPRTNTN
jgi:Cysteine-rich CWC